MTGDGSVYCSCCGQGMERRVPAGDHVARHVCPVCSYVSYVNPRILVACILHRGDRILWIRRALEPYAGRWAIPAGFMECGESVEHAACRELREETGLVVDPRALTVYGVFSIPRIDQVYISLIGELPSMTFGATPEADEVRLIAAGEIGNYEFAYPPETREFIERLYRHVMGGEVQQRAAQLAPIDSTYRRD